MARVGGGSARRVNSADIFSREDLDLNAHGVASEVALCSIVQLGQVKKLSKAPARAAPHLSLVTHRRGGLPVPAGLRGERTSPALEH